MNPFKPFQTKTQIDTDKGITVYRGGSVQPLDYETDIEQIYAKDGCVCMQWKMSASGGTTRVLVTMCPESATLLMNYMAEAVHQRLQNNVPRPPTEGEIAAFVKERLSV